jgi:hypothetical protein
MMTGIRRARLVLWVVVAHMLLPASPTTLSAQSDDRTVPLSSPDSLRLLEGAKAQVLTFIDSWRDTWTRRDSVRTSKAAEPRVDRPRPSSFIGFALNTSYNRCLSGELSWHYVGALAPVPTRIVGASSTRGYCPGWTFYSQAAPDAYRVIDSLLGPVRMTGVRRARLQLLAQLDQAARQLPGDDWIAGQRVRFLLDQEDYAAAQSVASACRGTWWWCTMLRGFADASVSDHKSAMAAFIAVRSALDSTSRCALEDLSPLIDPVYVGAYRALPCIARLEFNTRFWWLANPLWSDSINHREVEHYRRRIELMLRGSLPRDELFHYTADRGGDAVQQLAIRYGWPAWVAYPAVIQRANDDMLKEKGEPPSRPYAMLEYQRSRTHVAPSWESVRSLDSANAESWVLHEPDTTSHGLRGDAKWTWERTHRFRRLSLPPERLDRVRRNSIVWWPQEHFEPARPLVQLHEPQVALLRRTGGVHVAVAMHARSPLSYEDAQYGYRPHRSVRADTVLTGTVFLGLSQDSLFRLADTTLRSGGAMVLRGSLGLPQQTTQTAVLGAELRSVLPSGGDARTRFAVTVPPGLQALAPDSVAISAPVLLFDEAGTSNDLDALLNGMRPEAEVSVGERLRLYWESYGLVPMDTVQYTLQLTRTDVPGRARRLGMALGVANDTRGNLRVEWTEPSPDRQYVLIGPRAFGRTISLDLSNQAPGTYTVEIRLRTPDGRTTSNFAAFVLSPRRDER